MSEKADLKRRVLLTAILTGAAVIAVYTAGALQDGGFGAPTSVFADRLPALSDVHASVLAVGDVGARRRLLQLRDPQSTVGAGLELEDRRDAVDALVLLGDNFYDDGLEVDEIEERIRDNVVQPYCHFLDLSSASAPLAPRIASACPIRAAERHVVPLFAVLGNHDYGSLGSPRLQRDVLPMFVGNWKTPNGASMVVDVGPRLSLILLDSELVRSGASIQALSDSIRRARGPWRVLVTHRPIAIDPSSRYAQRVRDAVRRAGVAVHLVVSGHEHNLQAWTTHDPPALHAIAGSGAHVRPITVAGAAFALEALGFLRIDVAGSHPETERLYASFFATKRVLGDGGPSTLVSRWSVDPDGTALVERADASAPLASAPMPDSSS